ncbi:MAG: hypothetical protein P8P56_06425, partial [Yoonia sp.]|nr:hypothetical protein [Yoonia sp.]
MVKPVPFISIFKVFFAIKSTEIPSEKQPQKSCGSIIFATAAFTVRFASSVRPSTSFFCVYTLSPSEAEFDVLTL